MIFFQLWRLPSFGLKLWRPLWLQIFSYLDYITHILSKWIRLMIHIRLEIIFSGLYSGIHGMSKARPCLLSRLCIQEPRDIEPRIFSEYKGHHTPNAFLQTMLTVLLLLFAAFQSCRMKGKQSAATFRVRQENKILTTAQKL